MKTAIAVAIVLVATINAFGQVRYTDAFYMPEFSGCISRTNDGEAFWTCSDERRTEAPSNVIWKVNFTSAQIVLTNDNVWALNDMEGMAADTSGGYFIITSQSLSSDMTVGNASNRLRLAHYYASGYTNAVRFDLRGSMESAFPWLTSYWMMLPKLGGIDVEGLAYEPPANRLWIGLRGPTVVATNPATPGGHAVLLAMTNVMSGTNFNAGSFVWVTDTFPRYLDLGGEGIRDLFYDTDTTNLFILSGKLGGNEVFTDGQGNTHTNTQSCHLLAYKPANSNLTFCLRLPQVPNMPSNATAMSEAEGICAIRSNGVKRLLVTYDSKSNGVFQIFDFPDPAKFADPARNEGLFGM
jgi:hypothetical protein